MESTHTMPESIAPGVSEHPRHGKEEWDEFVSRTRGGTVFQSWDWGEARKASGWRPRRLSVRNGDSTLRAVALVGLRRVGPWTVAYCQRGPVWQDSGGLRQILEELRLFALRARASFVKVNPDLGLGDPDVPILTEVGYQSNPSQAYMHRATYRVDLARDDEVLLRRMEGRTRRAIARSRRDGVTVEVGTDPGFLARFETLVHATARRRRFAVPDHGFLESLRRRLAPQGRLRVTVARMGWHDVSAAVHLFFGDRCSYMWGGSTDDRELKRCNGSEALHWETMRAAKEAGFQTYDLHGTLLDREGNPQGGTAFFKRGFGGGLIRLPGDFELSLRKGLYGTWRALEPLYLRRKGGVC